MSQERERAQLTTAAGDVGSKKDKKKKKEKKDKKEKKKKEPLKTASVNNHYLLLESYFWKILGTIF